MSDAERLAEAMFRDAGLVLGSDAQQRLTEAGWRTPEEHAAQVARIAALEGALTAAEARADAAWQPIESAPRDGAMVLVHGGVAYWRDDSDIGPAGWWTITGEVWPGRPIQWEVKCWQPMPVAPQEMRP